MEYYSEAWNQIDLKDQVRASLEEEEVIYRSLRQTKKARQAKKRANPELVETYAFERLRKNVDRQNYFQVAKNFDSNLRVDYDQIKTLNSVKKAYNPFPDYTAPLVYKNLRYLTLDTPKAGVQRQRQLLRPELGMEFNRQGRIAPRIPRIGAISTKS